MTWPVMAQTPKPLVPYYKTGFEEMEVQTFTDDTVEIEGVRWRIVNGRIVDDPKANIPFGKKALELTAGYVGDVPAMIDRSDRCYTGRGLLYPRVDGRTNLQRGQKLVCSGVFRRR